MELKGSLKEIGKYGSIYMAGWALNSILRLSLLPVFTRYLDRAEYGTLSLLDSAIALIRVLSALGISSAIIRFFHDRQDAEHRRRVMATGLSSLMFMALITGCLLYPFSGPLTKIILGETGRPIYFQLTLATILLGLMRSGADSYFTTSKRAGTFVLANSGHAILNAIINLYLVVIKGMGVMGMLLGNLIVALLVNFILFVYIVRENGLGIDRSILKGMLRYGLPLVPAIWAAAAMHNMDRFFIRHYASLEEVGLYSLAYQFPFMLNMLFSTTFVKIWSASTMYSIARSTDASHQFGRICTYYMAALTFALYIISVASDTLISIFAAPPYFAAHRYLPVIALGVWGYALHIFVRTGVELSKKTYLFTVNYLLAFLVNLVLNLLFVPRWGAMGAAWVTVATYFQFSLGGYILYRNCYPIRLEWVRLAKLLCLAIGLVACRQLIIINNFLYATLIEIAFVAMFPALLLFALGFFTAGEKEEIKVWRYSNFKLGRPI